MNKLISIEQHLTCGHIIATMEIKGKIRSLVVVTSIFEESELFELIECSNVSDLEFEEYEHLDFYFKESEESPSKYIRFERQYL